MLRLQLSRIALLAIGATSLMACSQQPVQTPSLADTEWQLVEIEGKPPAVAEDKRPTLMLLAIEDRAHGNGGCNRYSGSYTRADNGLKFGAMMQTKIGCEAEINRSEQQFHAVLARVTQLRHRADQLELLANDGAVLLRLRALGSNDAP